MSVLELLRSPSVRYRTLNLWFNWTANVLVYYGIIFSFVDVGDDMYLSTVLGGLVEVPAYLASIGVCLLLGRRLPIAGAMLLAGACLLATIAVPTGRSLSLHCHPTGRSLSLSPHCHPTSRSLSPHCHTTGRSLSPHCHTTGRSLSLHCHPHR